MEKMEKINRIGIISGFPAFLGTSLAPYTEKIYAGILDASLEYNCSLLFSTGVDITYSIGEFITGWPEPCGQSCFLPAGPYNTDGLVVISHFLTEEKLLYIKKLHDNGFPIVCIGDTGFGTRIIEDGHQGLVEAVDFLVKIGRRRIAFIGGFPDDPVNSRARFEGYMSGLEKNSIPFDKKIVAWGYNKPEPGRKAMQSLLKIGPAVDAVIANNDDSASGVLTAIKESGLSVPDDIAVIGYDNTPLACIQDPPLTSVEGNAYLAGYTAIKTLFGRLSQKGTPEETITIPAYLVQRHSTPSKGLGFRIALQLGDTGDVREQITTLLQGTSFIRHKKHGHEFFHRLFNCCESIVSGKTDKSAEKSPVKSLNGLIRARDDNHMFHVVIDHIADRYIRTCTNDTKKIALAALFQEIHRASAEVYIRKNQHYIARHVFINEELSFFNGKLSAITGEEEFSRAFFSAVNTLAIEPAGICFYGENVSDPGHESVLHYHDDKKTIIKTRDFPGWFEKHYPESPWRISLMPIGTEKKLRGFVFFGMQDLPVHGSIIHLLTHTLERMDFIKRTEKSLHEKEILLQEVHHRVKNNLTLIRSLINLQEHYDTGKKIGDVLNQLQNRIYAVSLVHDKLYSDRSFSELTVKDYIEDLGANIIQSFTGIDKKIVLKITGKGEIKLDMNMAVPIGIIFNELITNSIKYAFKDNDRGEITIKITESYGKVVMTYTDSGPGLPRDYDPAAGGSLGMILIQNLAEQLQASLHFSCKGKFKAVLGFPVEIDTGGSRK